MIKAEESTALGECRSDGIDQLDIEYCSSTLG